MWVPSNYRSKSASKDRGDDVFRYIKKKKRKGNMGNKFTSFKQVKKLK